MEATKSEAESVKERAAVQPQQDDSDAGSVDKHVPHVQHDDYAEITLRGTVLAIFLAIMLGAANVYLGLLVGMTVSASIPASVMSMACLKFMERLGCAKANILENNIVQTAASAGEALASGIIMTLPGLVILNTERSEGNPIYANVDGWSSFMGSNYFYTTFLALFGGVLGIMWSIPLRRALIVEIEPKLRFPEGVAVAQVLKSGEAGGNSVQAVGAGAGLGGVVNLLVSMGIFGESMGAAWFYTSKSGSMVFPTSINVNVKSALLGVGYIIGPKVGSVLFFGSLFQWLVCVPVSAFVGGRYNASEVVGVQSAMDLASAENRNYSRYIGVGIMLVGGVWTLLSLRKALVAAVKVSVGQFKKQLAARRAGVAAAEIAAVPRTERDMPFLFIVGMLILSIIPLYVMLASFSGEWGWMVLMTIVIFVISFLFSAVGGYMAGLVGSSNNPISGVTICSSLLLSGLIIAILGADNPAAPSVSVMMTVAVATAVAISGDNMQDLKSGHILGATPWKQEAAMLVGVASASLVFAPVLELLNGAYGIGGATGLPAPQASIMASIPAGIVSGTLPWAHIGVGVALGALIICVDLWLEHKKSSVRLPVLAFAVSCYLPSGYMVSIFAGSMMHFFAGTNSEGDASDGILYSAGLVAGDSLMGILLAIPVVATSNANVLVVTNEPQEWMSWAFLALILYSLYYIGLYQPFNRVKVAERDHFVA
jgi:putative OPT family oligopeptide transporter